MKTTLHTLPRAQRLKSRRLIEELFEQSQGGLVYPIRYLIQERQLSPDTGMPPSGEPASRAESKPMSVDVAGATVKTLGGREAPPEVSVLFSVPKRNHKRANVRNLLKRRMREAYRQHKTELCEQVRETGRPLSLGLLYVGKEPLDYAVIERALLKILRILAEKRP